MKEGEGTYTANIITVLHFPPYVLAVFFFRARMQVALHQVVLTPIARAFWSLSRLCPTTCTYLGSNILIVIIQYLAENHEHELFRRHSQDSMSLLNLITYPQA